MATQLVTADAFGDTLTRFLVRRDWSQGQLARAARVTEGAVSRWIAGTRQVSRQSVGRLVVALRLNAADEVALYHAAGYLAPRERGRGWAA